MTAEKKYAIITGGGEGLGRSLALYMAAKNWHIALADINLEKAQETRELIEREGGSAQAELLDVSDQQAFEDLRRRLQSQWPRLDMLVNNAGVCTSGLIVEMDLADWDWLININLRGAVIGAHTMLPWLLENPGRSYIMNNSSVCAFFAPPKYAAYNISKAGMIALTDTLFGELRRTRVSVTAVCPWFVSSNLLDNGRFHKPESREVAKFVTRMSPVSPYRFAKEAYRATMRRKLYHVVGRRATLLHWSKKFIPKTFLRISALLFRLHEDYFRRKLEKQQQEEQQQQEQQAQAAQTEPAETQPNP